MPRCRPLLKHRGRKYTQVHIQRVCWFAYAAASRQVFLGQRTTTTAIQNLLYLQRRNLKSVLFHVEAVSGIGRQRMVCHVSEGDQQRHRLAIHHITEASAVDHAAAPHGVIKAVGEFQRLQFAAAAAEQSAGTRGSSS